MIEGARNFVEFAEIRSDENVLLVSEYTTDYLVLETLSAEFKAAAADLCIIYMDPAHGLKRKVPSMVLGAWNESDVMIDLLTHTLLHGDQAWKMILERKIRYYSMLAMARPQVLATGARFPPALFREIADKAYQKARQSKEVRVTDVRGTDVTAEIDHEQGVWDVPGRVFPGGVICLEPVWKAEGIIYFDIFTGFGRTTQPIKLTIEENTCTSIEGGIESEWLRDHTNVENGKNFAEVAFGLNPWMRLNIDDDPTKTHIEAHRHAGVAHMALGRADGTRGVVVDAATHIDGTIVSPTVYLDDEIVVDRGKLKLLDDPEIHELAKHYGDPKTLLSVSMF